MTSEETECPEDGGRIRPTDGGERRVTGKEVTRLSEGTEEMSERRSLPWPGSAGRDGEGP